MTTSLSASAALRFFRTAVCILMFIHGATRIYRGTVGGFGEFLEASGFPLGLYLAWAITLFELVGTVALALDYFAPWICLLFILELVTGLVLVHFQNGWFVVGGGTGGMEYSVLLILSFALIGATSLASRR